MTTITKAGRYEILGELGRGAMGVVYRAVDPVIGRNVAVKTIRLTEQGTGLSRPELLARFQTEARAAGLLTHPNIVVVYDAGEEDGLYYITMELVEGKSLQALLDGGYAFPVSRVLRILEQTCSALQFAHERNIVHRDIKPANLMLTADDTVKVTDFGTAKILQFGAVQQTTHVMGTPSYMSPEQVKGRPVDGRTDIFSLGVVFYEMLTGEKPFPGQTITTVIYKIVNEEPVPPRQLNPSIHPGLNEIVLRALAKEPDVRYRSCRELWEDLRNYRSLGGNDHNPDATLVSSRQGSPFATPSVPLRPLQHDDSIAAGIARLLQSRATAPSQTPSIRRTGPMPPYVEPKKKPSTLATVLAGILLICVIVFGVVRLRPELEATRQLNKRSQADSPANTPSAPKTVQTDSSRPGDNSSPEAQTEDSTKPAPKGSGDAPQTETEALPPTPVTAKKDFLVSPAADYKRQIEQALAANKLTGRVKVRASGDSLTLSGKLRPAEHASLLRFMRSAPANIHVVDDILYDDALVTNSGQGGNDAHTVQSAADGAIHLVTDIVGATATLFAAAGRVMVQCQTPCSFTNLEPMQYSLQIKKDGYLPMQTAFDLKAGQVLDRKFTLEALAKGLLVSSRPPGADILINGAKQSGQTPATLPLGPGQYDLVLRLSGYEAYSGHVQVKDNIQTTLDVELKQRSEAHVAWVQVNTSPSGAEIYVDGAQTGEVSPARVQMPAGTHIIALKISGFQIAKRQVEASEGGTVHVNETLRRQ
jgi:serine/threonine protein kinase